MITITNCDWFGERDMRHRIISAVILLVVILLLGASAARGQLAAKEEAARAEELFGALQTFGTDVATHILEKKQETVWLLMTPEERALHFLPGIICWGDSLTYGEEGDGVSFPQVLRERIAAELLEIPVINMGASGEDSITIAGRSGGIPYIVVEDLVIPADTSEVPVVISSEDGRRVVPGHRMDVGINACSIAGVTGTLTTLERVNPDTGYTFRRSEPGEQVAVPAGTKIITEAAADYQDYLSIVYVGTNGGYEDYDDLIAQQNAIIASRVENTDRYLIIGLTDGSREELAEYDAAMYVEYGDKYFNLREFLASSGVAWAGLEPTREDELAKETGVIPPSLMAEDGIHFNPKGYAVIGNVVFEKLNELGYFDEARAELGK